MPKTDTQKSQELAVPQFDRDALAGIQTFEDAIKVLQESGLGGEVVTSDVLGDGFSLLDDKDKLIGVPLMFVTWNFSGGDYGEFVSCRVLAKFPGSDTATKYVINDGSTGIYAMLRELSDKNPHARMLFAPRGLRKSTYIHPKHGPGTTHYIDTAKAPN